MPSSLMMVLIELSFLPRMQLLFENIFLLLQDTIILLTRSTSNFGEEGFIPPIDGEISVWVTSPFFSRRRFAWMEVNIPGVIHGLWSALFYKFLV